MLDNHALEIKFAKGGRKAGSNQSKQKARTAQLKPTCTILVKNVAFEATKAEIRELFAYVALVIIFAAPLMALCVELKKKKKKKEPLDRSRVCDYQRRWMAALVALHSLTLSPNKRQKMHSSNCRIPISTEDTLVRPCLPAHMIIGSLILACFTVLEFVQNSTAVTQQQQS